MSADVNSGSAAGEQRGLVRTRQRLITASSRAALLTGAVAIWVATELRVAGPEWLPWLACALPPRPGTRSRAQRLVLTASVLMLLCAGVAVVTSAIVTAVMISISGTRSRRRASAWTVAGLAFAALLIPSPVYVTGGPIQTIFAGNTDGENAAAVCNLVLLALALVVAGLASARMAAVIAVAWLPGAAAEALSWYVYPVPFLHLDAWLYVSWLGWLSIAVLTLAQARNWRPGEGPLSPEAPGANTSQS